MLRAFVFTSVLALTASAACAQPAGDTGAYPAPPPTSPSGDQAGPQPPAYPPDAAGQPYAQGGRRSADPMTRDLRRKMRAVCAPDISTYCADAGQGGHGALHRCMMANQTNFAPACQAAIGDLRAHMHPGADAAPPPPPPPPPPQ